MEILWTDNEIIQAIQEYLEHNFIQVETWEKTYSEDKKKISIKRSS